MISAGRTARISLPSAAAIAARIVSRTSAIAPPTSPRSSGITAEATACELSMKRQNASMFPSMIWRKASGEAPGALLRRASAASKRSAARLRMSAGVASRGRGASVSSSSGTCSVMPPTMSPFFASAVCAAFGTAPRSFDVSEAPLSLPSLPATLR